MKFRGNAAKILTPLVGLTFGLPTFFGFVGQHDGGKEGGAGLALYFTIIVGGMMFLIGAAMGAFIGIIIDQKK